MGHTNRYHALSPLTDMSLAPTHNSMSPRLLPKLRGLCRDKAKHALWMRPTGESMLCGEKISAGSLAG